MAEVNELMPERSDDAERAVRFFLGDDAQDADVAALTARLQQPAEAMCDEQLAAGKRFGELEARLRYAIDPE